MTPLPMPMEDGRWPKLMLCEIKHAQASYEALGLDGIKTIAIEKGVERQ
jgi:hypothetical protein